MKLVSPNFADLLSPNIEIKRFPDGDSYVRIPNLEAYRDKDVTIFHRLYPQPDVSILQTLFMLNSLHAVNASTTLVAPYLPYARQDKIFLEGEVKSADIICSLLASAGLKKLITFNCHFMKKEGEIENQGLKIKNISFAEQLIEHAKKKFDNKKFDIIAPDKGALYLVEKFGGKAMEKVRGGYVKGDVAHRAISKMVADFELKEKNVLIVDDMISGGGTMIEACKVLREMGAKKIFCAATHGFFLNDALLKLNEVCDGVFVSNSIPSPVSEVDILQELKNQKVIDHG
ncbi:MAG: ribose-phosphate diphosphokinase [Candidatus Micrarchaeota archaeon]